MKNLYQILGVDDTASQQQIKQAYRRLALTLHPDRGGDVSQMALINEAYEILIDPVKRRDFDEAWQAYQTANIDEDGEIQCDGHLAAGSSVPFSKSFKDKHQALIFQYEERPLEKNTAAGETESFESSCYQVDRADGPQRYHDIFSFIRAKNALAGGSPLSLSLAETLTPVVAAQLLMDFLAGKIWGDELRRVADYLSVSLRRLDRTAGQTSERLLYEGVYEIISMAEAYVPNSGLLLSLKKISDFAKSASEVTLPRILPLFYNKYFRNLFAYALHLYWHTNEDLFDEADLSQFEGFQSARELLESLKDRLSSESNKKQLTTLILYVKLLANLEKDFKKARTRSVTAEDYRESAFHLLDWIPALREGSSQAIIINTFLQIGTQFQQASALETHPAKKMADEQLALQVYAIAAAISERATPDIEIYIKNQMIKRVSAFEYQDQSVKEYVPALKKRMLALTNVFPFFESLRSNISYLKQDNQMLHLMRQLLNAMINILEYNKSHREPIAIDHSAVTVLYQAYEACLKNWYQDTYSPETETKFRQDLMDELLFENGWTFWDVEENTDSPWSMIDRDVQGWIQPSRALPYAEDPAVTIYSAINGAELNSETGEINFFMTPWRRDRPEYEKVLSLYDLQEMLQKNLGGAIFSLDPVAPDKPFHPFNQMRFSPSQLCESELLDTMLLTDYILKFLTTNQEVQGQYPFAGRPVASMIEHLPEYLQNIIENFHQGQHSGAIHRFWIEAEAVDVLVSDDIPGEANTTRVRLDNIKMVVKKHRMERDIHGNLVDVGNEDEGWPIYVLTQAQMDELILGRRSIEGPAMVFIYGQAKLHYWENHAIVHSHTPQHVRESLIRLYKQAKAANGKIKQTSTNASLLYRLTKEMAGQSGQPHRYSREFIFAHEFTQHYDEFAQYLPAFGRLKELSKVAALVRFLDGIRLANQETIKAIERCLDNSSHPELEETERYQQLKQGYQKNQASIISQFKELRKKFSLSVLKAQYRKNMQSLRAQIGTIELGPHSDEVNEVCQRCYDDTQRQNGYAVPSSLLWDRINSQRKEFAQQISSSRRASYKKQLDEMFSNRLSSYSKDRLYEAFLQRDIAPLADALAAHNGDEIKRDIQRQYPRSLPNDIGWALDEGNDDAVLRIAASEARLQMQTLKTTKKNVTSGFEAIKFAKHDKPISLTGQCFWVPASVKHEVVLDKAGLSRYSFFVYGGVNVQPRLNIRPGGNGPVGGNRVGGGGGGDGSGGRGGFNRAEIIKGFQSHHLISPTNKATQNHPLLRLAGITTRQQMDARPNRIYLPYQRTGPVMENGKSHHPTRSIHNGRHTQEAMDAVAQRMTAVARTGRAENWSQAQYREGLRSLQAELRQELRTGQVALNSRHEPPNPSRR